MDLSSIGTSIGQYIRQGIAFILNVNNLPITIGMVLIFCIVMFVMKGTKHIIDSAFFLVLAFFVISCLCGEFGIELDVASVIHQFIQFILNVFGGIDLLH